LPASSASRSRKAPVFSCGPMAVFSCSITSPASSFSARRMIEMPVSCSPSQIAHRIGAAPR
jgi:hypothetical protein